MPTYLVVWKIELDAETPEEAAILAREIQADPNSLATNFDIYDEDGKMTPVDTLDF